MKPILKNIIAVVAGALVGMIVNIGIIMTSHFAISYPEGMILGDTESLKEYLPQFELRHFIMPWLAHALGTLAGAYIAAKIAANRKMLFASIIGIFFLIGGIMNIQMVGGPLWFNVIDVIGAYIPMAFLGYKLAGR